LPFVLFLDIIAITPCIRFHKSIIKENTVDIIHKMDFVYSLDNVIFCCNDKVLAVSDTMYPKIVY
ncbi:hypothetical protein, partial [Enterococcus faecium]|uniref:hypothetical protein n=1 Tax=Enterococcus faecium TaxID=1352 RepID=UPI0022A8B721